MEGSLMRIERYMKAGSREWILISTNIYFDARNMDIMQDLNGVSHLQILLG